MRKWNPKANEVFAHVLEIETNPERIAYLERECGDDMELRAQVEAMLRSHEQAGSFLNRPASGLNRESSDGLTAAFTSDEVAAAVEGDSGSLLPVGDSVLKALEASMAAVPKVQLRDLETDAITPVNRPSSEEMPEPKQMPQRYFLLGEIARGGMGAILKGHDVDLGRDIAVKMMLETHKGKTELLQRFVEEAQISGQLQHPGIAPVYEMGQTGDRRPYFTMKLVKGKTLAALLKERPASGVASAPRETGGELGDHSELGALTRPRSPVDLPRFLAIFEQICQTMAYAHARGVIHRDLKPANIMVGNFGEVQVMDWGLAKVLAKGGIADEKQPPPEEVSVIRTVRSEGSNTSPEMRDSGMVSKDQPGSQTQTGSVLGTPAYMAPEQARGEIDNLDERCDVFGLGAILCQILTGAPPYQGNNISEIHKKALKADLSAVQQRLKQCDADRELIELTQRCLQFKKEDRPRDAALVSEAVTAYLESVQSRLKQAEIQAAEAHVRAEAEQKQRQLAEGKAEAEQKQRELAEQKATSEKKRRRATLAMAVAAFLLLGSLGIGGYAAWRQWKTEETRYTDGIARVYQLIENYRYQEAEAYADNLHNTRSFWVPQSLGQRLQETRKDARLLRDLDRVRRDKAIIIDGKFADPAHATKQYEKVIHDFATKAGFKKSKGLVPQALLKWIGSRPSVVREQVSAALGDWAVCFAKDKKPSAKRVALLDVITRLEPNSSNSELLQLKVWDDPKKLDQRIASLDPTKASAQLLHSISLKLRATKGDLAAADFLEQVHEHHPTDFWLLFTLANRYEQLKEIDLAIGCYRAASAVRPSVSVVYNNWGSVLIYKHDCDGAIVKFKRAIEINPNSANAYSGWGIALSRKKDYDGANAKYKKAAEIDPNYAHAYYNWGISLNGQRDYDGAIAKYRKATELDPNYAEAHCNWGIILAEKKDYDGAIEKYKKAAAVNRKLVQAYTGWGNALSRKHDYKGAIAKFKEAIELDPNDAKTYNNWGNALSDKKDYDGAIAKFKKANELDPKNANAYNNWAIALDSKKDYDGAIGKYKKANELDPKNAKIYLNWGYALYHKQDYQGAIAKYQKAIEIDPKDSYAYTNWGIVLYAKGDHEGAIAKYKKAIELDPKDAVTYNNWGDVLLDKGDYNGAIAKYQKATEINPNYADAYGNWGKVLAKKQDYEGAIAKYKKATEIDPKDASPYNNWGAILCDRKKDYDGAIALFRKAVSLDPKVADGYYNWGNALLGKKDYDGAVAKFKLTLKYAPDYAEANCNLGLALEKQGQFESALKYYRLGHTLGTKRGPAWRYPSAAWVQRCEQLLTLDKQLTSIIKSQRLPTNPLELLAWAKFCHQFKKQDPTAMKFVKTIESCFQTLKTWNGTLSTKQKEQTHQQKLQAGKTYLIEMQSKHFDTYLRLRDAKRKILDENDDIAKNNLNSRIIFTPKQDGAYRIVATSYQQSGTGEYTLSVREFTAKKR